MLKIQKHAKEDLQKMGTKRKKLRTQLPGLKKKKSKYNWPRDVAVRVFFRHSRWTLGRIGVLFRISYSAVSKAVSRVEEKMQKSAYLAREIETLEDIFSKKNHIE